MSKDIWHTFVDRSHMRHIDMALDWRGCGLQNCCCCYLIIVPNSSCVLAAINYLQRPSLLSMIPTLCMPTGLGATNTCPQVLGLPSHVLMYMPAMHNHSRAPKHNSRCCYLQLTCPQQIPGELGRRPRQASKDISNIYF